MAFDCTIHLTRLYSTKLWHKNQAAAHIFKIYFSVLPHTLQQAIPQFAALRPERFIYGDALDDGFSVMHRLRMFLFGLFIKSLFLLHGINPPLLIGIQKGILEYNFWENFKKFWKVYSKSGLRIPIYRRTSFDRSAAYGKRQVFFCLRARFACVDQKLPYGIFVLWQSWWGFRSPFPRHAQNHRFWLSGFH